MSAYEKVRKAILQQATDGEVACSVPTLARLTRYSKRSVQYVLYALRGEDEIVLVAPSRQHHPARYRLAGSLAEQFAARSPRGHLGVVPATQPEVQPGSQVPPPPGTQSRGDYRGVPNATTPRARRRRGLRANGTNPRALAAKRKLEQRDPRAGTTCENHHATRNDLGLCSGCRADQLAGTA